MTSSAAETPDATPSPWLSLAALAVILLLSAEAVIVVGAERQAAVRAQATELSGR